MSDRPNNVLDLREVMRRRQQEAEQASGFGARDTEPESAHEPEFENDVHDEVFAKRPEDLHRPGVFERIKDWFSESKREQAPSFHNHVTYKTPTLSENGILYNTIAHLGWFFEKVILLALLFLKLIRFVLLVPIKILDHLLDLFAKGGRKSVHLGAKQAQKGAVVLVRKIKKYEFHPQYQWYKSTAAFLVIAFLFVAPVKIYFDEIPKIVHATQQVLGVSTKAVRYFGLFQEAKGFLPAAVVGKEFLGFNGPRRYLVIFQNNAELRPTGGFMGSYAVIDVKNGAIQKLEVPEGGFYDLKGYSNYKTEAPKPFHMFSPYWQIWNANWFASFPLSAEKIAQFYEQSGAGSTVDGIVTLTPNVIEKVLAVTGPIEMPEYDTTITAENFRTQTQTEVEIEYDRAENTPKAFIGDLLPILADRIIDLVNNGEAEQLLAILDTAFSERHILMYSNNAIIEENLRELGWAGELKAVPQDYLQIVHTNIGGGKTDLAIKDTVFTTIEYKENGDIVNTVMLTRSHTGDSEDAFEGKDNLDYIRFYVPFGTQLISAEGFLEDDITERYKTSEEDEGLDQDIDLLLSYDSSVADTESKTEIYTESNRTVFGNWLSLKPGQVKTVTLTYRLPFKHTEFETHHHYWQKQAGSIGAPITTTITLPPTLAFENWLPQSSNVALISEQELRYTNDLRTDRIFSFTTTDVEPEMPEDTDQGMEFLEENASDIPKLPE